MTGRDRFSRLRRRPQLDLAARFRLQIGSRIGTRLAARARGARPLDQLRTIKIKLGVLVATSTAATALILWYGLVYLGWLPRYTLPAAIIVALAITQVLAHGMTSPLREMTAAARAMARGDYSRRVPASSRDEVGELARAFNRMAADLEQVETARKELVANVSHELRTPISALHALLENVVDGVSDPDPDTMRTALAQTERLGRLVAQLLDLSRLESGAVPLALTEFEVGPFLARAVEEAKVAANGTEVSFAVDVTPPDLRAVADPERLAQVVANLVDNARRHSPAGGRITVTAQAGELPGSLRVEVADEGPGIPVAERAHVFERFSRGGGASAADGGTGLGLAIARWAVDLHSGQIGVADSPVGCRIRVALPGTTPHHNGEDLPMSHDTSLEAFGPPPSPVALRPDLTEVWSGPERTAPPSVLIGAAVTGLLGAWLTVGDQPGIGVLLVGLAATAVTWPVARARRSGWTLTFGGLALALLSTVALRATEWLVALCLLAAFGLASLALAGGRSWLGVLLGGATVPLAGLRMPPWVVRSLTSPGQGRADLVWRALRAMGVGGVLLLLFGALFASADAAFRDLVDRILPDASLADVPQRVVAFTLTAGLALAAAYVAMSVPRWDRLTLGPVRPLRRFEWVLPIVALDALFATFVIVQLTVLFGGHERILRGTGLTYAEYARAGFGQLVFATLLTLGVVAATARLAPREQPSDRRLVRLLLGVLCGLTLVIVASALRRLALYEEAYGLTVARLFAAMVELWFGTVILLVLAAGIRLRGFWLPRAVVISGAVALLTLVAINPDGFVADRNVDRFARTGKIDTYYLSTLSADAAPALNRLPEPERSCALGGAAATATQKRPWYSENLGLIRARRILEDRPLGPADERACYQPGFR